MRVSDVPVLLTVVESDVLSFLPDPTRTVAPALLAPSAEVAGTSGTGGLLDAADTTDDPTPSTPLISGISSSPVHIKAS